MNLPLRVAAIGTGGVAQFHLDYLSQLPDVSIVGLCDVVLSKAEASAQKFGGKPYADMDALLDETEPDAVFIMTPPTVREGPIAACCARGIPFFCEKPPAFTPEDAARNYALIERAGVIHTVGFMWRHLQIADAVKTRLKGRPVSLVAHTFINGPLLSPHLPPWFKLQEKSGGPLFDQAIHVIDVSRYVLGDVARVGAIGNNLVFPKAVDLTIEDSLSLLLEYESGTAGTYIHGWAHEGTSVSSRFVGRDFDLTAAWHDRILTGTDRGEAVHETYDDNSYHTEVVRFLDAVRNRDPYQLRSTYADAVRTLSVAWAAERSMHSGRLEETRPYHVETPA